MRRHLSLEVLTLSFLATNLGNFPAFSIGALGPELIAEFGLSEVYVGALVSTFYALSAMGSFPSGLVVERFGWPRTMMVMGVTVASAGVCLSVPAGSFGLIVVGMVIAGAGNALVQPAANEALLSQVPFRRRGLALGIKQTAGPAATVIAGLSLVFIVPIWGWRAVLYWLVPLGLLLCFWAYSLRRTSSNPAAVTPPVAPGPVQPSRAPRPGARTPLFVLCAAAGLGAAAANGITTFYVIDAVAQGVSSGAAGIMLAVASLVSVLTRLLSGFLADLRTGGHLRLVAIMMAAGGVGMGALVYPGSTVVFAVGAVLGLGVGWGWNGLLQHGMLALYRDSAAQVTGILQTFVFAGAVVGPFTVGWMAEIIGFRVAWAVVAVGMVLSALGVTVFRIHVRRHGV